MREKFQLPSGRLWRALRWEDRTVVIMSNIHHPTIVSRCHVCGTLNHFYNWKEGDLHPRCSVFSHQSNMREFAEELTSYVNRETERDSKVLTSSEICDPNVTQVPEREERRRRLFCLRGWNREDYFSACAPTHLTRGRRHGGLTSPGFCAGKDRKKKKNQKQTVRLWVKCGCRFICTCSVRAA